MESFEIPDSVRNLFLNASSKSLKAMNKYMQEEKECEGSYTEYEIGINLQKYLGVYIVCLLSVVGILLNILCIRASIEVYKKTPKNLFNVLLLNLLSWDTIFLILNMSRKITTHENKESHDYYHCSVPMAKILVPFGNIALAQSVFATLTISIERYICIIHEKIYMKYVIVDKRSTTLIIQWLLPVTIMVFLVHIPEFFGQNNEIRTTLTANNTVMEEICLHNKPNAPNVDVYFKAIIKVVIDGFFPLICLLYCNIKTFVKVRKNIRTSLRNSQEKSEEENEKLIRAIEQKLAKIMIGIVSVFVLCQIPYLILSGDQSIRITNWLLKEKDAKCEWIYPPYIVIMDPIVHLMLTINCSVNVIFYCFFDSGYRHLIFPCFKNNQVEERKKLVISPEENTEEDAREEFYPIAIPEENE